MASPDGPTAYIHVGPHKTGSSSIKHFCHANRDALLRLRLFFPLLLDEDGEPARNHSGLARGPQIRPDGRLKPSDRLWPEIDAIARARSADILLSSEMFCRALGRPKAFSRIVSYFESRGYRVVVLAYVRDQPGWLNSWYVQAQKRLVGLVTFDKFCADAERAGRVDPWLYLKTFIEEPRCELRAIPFERAIAAGLELDFVGRCGVPTDAKLERVPRRNRNAGAKSVYAAQEIMRRAGPHLNEIRGYGPLYNGFKRRCRALGFDDTPYVAVDQIRFDRIRERYAQANDSFARTHLGAGWTELCPPRRCSISIFDPSTASRSELDEIETLVADMVEKLRALRRGNSHRRRAPAG